MSSPAGDTHLPQYRRGLLARMVADPAALTQEEAQTVIHAVEQTLRMKGYSAADAQDATSTALERFLEAARLGKVAGIGPAETTPNGNPWSYLVTIALNEGANIFRRTAARSGKGETSLETLGEHSHPSDDNVARRLDEQADASAIQDALRRAIEKNDATAVKVITVMLDMISTTGEVPSTRDVGAALGISHTAVLNARARFRAYLDQLTASSGW